MAQPDYRGARGSNAGDDFHELWALRQALALLDQASGLTAVTVEGLITEDESGTSPDTWDGVDCTLYYGGDQADKAERIVIAQLKYSAANSDQAWTVARLTYSANKKKDNSVLRTLAKAFAGLKHKRPDLVASQNVIVRLVSNQPIDQAVVEAISDPRSSHRATLLNASGLDCLDFEMFVKALDLSECGSGSRFRLEERVLETISDWTDDDARVTANALLRFVHRAMLPEAKGEFIIRQSILVWMGFSDVGALFPCPPALKRVDSLISRAASRIDAERMKGGDQRICLHGEGGSGKTTALQEIEALLPDDSTMIIFDCYGNGRYLNSDAYRHRVTDAFLQMSNELAGRLSVPLLLSPSRHLDYPKVFKNRLTRAAEVVSSRSPGGLLVMVVDAADNSVIAASTRSPKETSFVFDYLNLGELPANVRLLVTARTGRLRLLNLPDSFSRVEIKGFELGETTLNVRRHWTDAPDNWIEDFHHLSGGNPRVQQYALDYAGSEVKGSLEYLRPSGKNLDQIFHAQLEYARKKVGLDRDIKLFCAGLVALPRPIPLTDLAAVTDFNTDHVRDLCADLAPGVRLINELVGFSDEDFEHFVRAEGQVQLPIVQARIAAYFHGRHTSDAYAAAHVATALHLAGRGRDILDLINIGGEPKAIGDPVLRREVQRERLRIAMKVCREAGNNVDAMLTLLTGAEALKTDAAIHHMLIENPDLAANFASDNAGRVILRDPDQVENHGPLLFHLMSVDARRGDRISVREGYRQVRAWLQRRHEEFEYQKTKYPQSVPQDWSIGDRDIAAEIEAALRISGPQSAVEYLRSWRPSSIALRVASILSRQLTISGETSLIWRCLTEAGIQSPWDLFLLTPLALAGENIDISRLEHSLARLLRRGLISIDRLTRSRRDDDTNDYFDTILTACEIIVARGGNRVHILPVLEQFAKPELRRRDQLYTFQALIIDLTLRAHALIEHLAGREPNLDTYLVNPPDPPRDFPTKKVEELKKADSEKYEELTAFIGPLFDVYDIRAKALLGSIPIETVGTQIQAAISHYHGQEYRIRRQYDAPSMRRRAALSLTRLILLPGLNPAVTFNCAIAFLGTRSDPLGSTEAQILDDLSFARSLHQKILVAVTDRAKKVRELRTSAQDKVAALIRLSRLLLPISFDDSRALFNQAVEVAGEIDEEAIHEISLFAPLATRAVASMNLNERRAVAGDLAIVVSDTAMRLEGHVHFPWAKVAEALSSLDLSFALAAVGRWEDMNIVSREMLLPPILEAGLIHHEISSQQVAGLFPLRDRLTKELIGHIVTEATARKGDLDLDTLVEELAREELLRFGHGIRKEVSERLNSLVIKSNPGPWLDRLLQATRFHQVDTPSHLSPTPELKQKDTRWQTVRAEEQKDPSDCIEWRSYRFVSAKEVEDVIGTTLEAARASNTYVSVSVVFDKMRSVVRLGDRRAHLDALVDFSSSKVSDYELADALSRGVLEWRGTPAVDNWCRERLLNIVVEQLPGFSRFLGYDRRPLPDLLEKSGLPDQDIAAALIEGLERHVDSFNAPAVYALVGLVGKYCLPAEAAQVITRYANRLVQRIIPSDREKWDITDVPTNVSESMARYLYALMGDVDVRSRWRTAHAIRSLVRLGDSSVIDGLLPLYDRKSEASYRSPDAPFYWLAARLWLMITLDRISDETPLALKSHGQRLLKIACDDSFPHILVRAFAKSAVSKLVAAGTMHIDPIQRKALKNANTSRVRRRKARTPSYKAGFDRYADKQREERRFHFDTMDTLPYWYSGAMTRFADLDREKFLDAAERWIVDRWGVRNNPWQWDHEPRKRRFSDDSIPSWHSHGSLPILERFHTYLEWHAMWCATGELMRRNALIKVENDYDTFEHWLSGNGLTASPQWLADLRGPKPLESRFWFAPPGDVNKWIEDVVDNDFLTELGLLKGNEMMVVEGHHETRSRSFMLSVQVRSALVSCDTAISLVRALQTVNDSWDYHIPLAGDDSEIDVFPYNLKGWIFDDRHDLGIDERDPFRYEMRGLEYCPSVKTVTVLNLRLIRGTGAQWVDAKSRKTLFVYEAWGDNRGDEGERLRYDETVRSSGSRLLCDKEALRTILKKTGLDLIVEIEITRRTKGYEYSRHDEEEAKESRFDRVVVLRRDGTIETAEGCLGSWTTPRS